ncbi:hypothetical protein GCM10027093_20420 [Paraburkholderia jirisanensis]
MRDGQASVKGILTNAYKGNATRHATICLSYINLALPSYPMKVKYRRRTPLVAATLALVALMGGCAVYPNGAPAYGSYDGYGDNGYGGYDGYGYGYAPPPQTNLFLGFGGYSGRSYYGGDRYERRGYRGGDWHGRGGGGGGHGGGGGPHGAPQAGGGSGGGAPPAAGPSGGGRGNGGGGGGNRGAKVDVSPNNGSRITNH